MTFANSTLRPARLAHAPSLAGRLNWPLIGFAAAALIAAVLVLTPPPLPLLRYSGDWIALLDAAYRLDHGQTPHVDFSAPVGALPLLLAWAATHLAEAGRAFWTMQGLQWFCLAPFAAFVMQAQPLAWRKLAVLAGFSAPLLIPYVIDADVLPEFNGNGIYNRFCTAGLFLLFAALATPKRRDWAWSLWFAGLLLLLAFTKITAALLGAGALASLAVFHPVLRTLALRALGLALLAIGLLELATGLPHAYLADIAAMATLNQGRAVYFLATAAMRSWAGALAVGFLALAWSSALTRGKFAALQTLRAAAARPRAALRRAAPLIFLALAFAVTLAAESQNTGALNLYAMSALLFLPLRQSLAEAPMAKAAFAIMILACLLPAADNAFQRGVHFFGAQTPTMQSEPALSAALAGLRVPAASARLADEMSASWNALPASERTTAYLQNRTLEPPHALAQLRLLAAALEIAKARRLIVPATHTTTINLVDSATRMAGATPARGAKLWLDPARTLGAMDGEAGRRYLADVDAAFQPVCGVSEEMHLIAERLMPALWQDFRAIPLTHCWVLWRRR